MSNVPLLLCGFAGLAGVDGGAWWRASVTAERFRRVTDWWPLYRRGYHLPFLGLRLAAGMPFLLLAVEAHERASDVFAAAAGGALLIYGIVFCLIFRSALRDFAPG